MEYFTVVECFNLVGDTPLTAIGLLEKRKSVPFNLGGN